MGAEQPVPLDATIGPFATRSDRCRALLPGVAWPAQIELRAGRHVVRPRYEVVAAARTRIAHVNVERADLKPDPDIRIAADERWAAATCCRSRAAAARFRTIVQPTPMASRKPTCRCGWIVFDRGRHASRRAFPRLPAARP